MAADAKTVMELRERTGAGVMDCKAALQAANGNLDEAVEFLRKKGLADAKKREHRDAKDGLVHAYIHAGAKLGVLIEGRTKLPNRKAFLLAAPGLETKRALQISGLDRHFSVHDSVDEALAAEV